MLMIKELFGIQTGNGIVKYVYCLFYVYCTSKPDYKILDAPVSNRLIIEQGVPECLNIPTVVEYTSFVDSFGSWCIIASLISVIR